MTVVCTDPVDGPVAFTVKADDVHARADFASGGRPPTGSSSSTAATTPTGSGCCRARRTTSRWGRCAPAPTPCRRHRPLHADQPGRAVPAGSRAHLRAHRRHVRRRPAPVAAGWTPPTSAVATSARPRLEFPVDSDSDDAHDLGVSLQVPRGYDDPTLERQPERRRHTGHRPRHGSADPGRADPADRPGDLPAHQHAHRRPHPASPR